MKRVRKVAIVVYLLAGIVVVGAFAGSLFGPYTDRVRSLLATCLLYTSPSPRD